MKKGLISLFFLSLSTLASCGAPTPPDDYGLDFNTPEFFLARMNPEKTLISVSSIDYSCEDFKLEVRDKIFARDDFEQLDEVTPTSDQYLSYYTLLNETSMGPHYAELCIYTDGILRIDYKEPRYPVISFYFSMDAEIAKDLYSLVTEKVMYAKAAEDTATAEAKEKGTIEKFIESIGTGSKVYTGVYLDNAWKYYYDSGEMINKIKTVTHTYADDKECKSMKLVYNLTPSNKNAFSYNLDLGKSRASLKYEYKDILGRKFTLWSSYSLAKKDYNAIYDLAKSLV